MVILPPVPVPPGVSNPARNTTAPISLPSLNVRYLAWILSSPPLPTPPEPTLLLMMLYPNRLTDSSTLISISPASPIPKVVLLICPPSSNKSDRASIIISPALPSASFANSLLITAGNEVV